MIHENDIYASQSCAFFKKDDDGIQNKSSFSTDQDKATLIKTLTFDSSWEAVGDALLERKDLLVVRVAGGIWSDLIDRLFWDWSQNEDKFSSGKSVHRKKAQLFFAFLQLYSRMR